MIILKKWQFVNCCSYNQPAIHLYGDVEMYDDKCDDKLMDELVSKSVETMKFVFGAIPPFEYIFKFLVLVLI